MTFSNLYYACTNITVDTLFRIWDDYEDFMDHEYYVTSGRYFELQTFRNKPIQEFRLNEDCVDILLY